VRKQFQTAYFFTKERPHEGDETTIRKDATHDPNRGRLQILLFSSKAPVPCRLLLSYSSMKIRRIQPLSMRCPPYSSIIIPHSSMLIRV
jgi:hypothetical protein